MSKPRTPATAEQRAKWNAAYKARQKAKKAQQQLFQPEPQPESPVPSVIPVEPIPEVHVATEPVSFQTNLKETQMYSTNEAIQAASNNPALNPALALVRCRISNLDPKKADLPGEIITVGNSQIGVVRKFVPFGEQTDNGYHIPKIIYDFLKERRFLNITTHRGKGKGETISVKQQWLPEFSLEVLPPLTKEELEELAQQQRAAAE